MKEYRTYTLRLFPTTEQKANLQKLSFVRNSLYNDLIEIEQNTYKTEKKLKSEYDLDKIITVMRKRDGDLSKVNSRVCQLVAKEVFGAYRSFLTLIKKDHTARPPRKIEHLEEFHTISYGQHGWKILNKEELRINGIIVKYKGIPNMVYNNKLIKELKLKYKNGKYLIDICVEKEIADKEEVTVNNKVLAIDLGLKRLVNGIDNNGDAIFIKNKARLKNKYFRKQIARVQSKQSRCKIGSNRHRKLAKTIKKLYKRKNAQVAQALHAQSKTLASMNYKTIVVGDLSVKQLMSREKNKNKNTRRSFDESCISTFLKFLCYKCKSNNTEVETISERWTTQTNCLTGKLFENKVELLDRVVKLDESILIDRDLNAAINIMRRYEQNHLALLTAPLDIPNVVRRYNLLSNTKTEALKL